MKIKNIDGKIEKIKTEISMCNPLMLLKFTNNIALMSHMNKFSEFDYTLGENIVIRAQEYIQSILVASKNDFNKRESSEEQENRYHLVLADIEDIYKEFTCFYHYWSAYSKNIRNYTDEMMLQIVEAQMFYLVRGNRYQIFQLEPLKSLLPVHNDVLVELFGVTAEQIIVGLEKLEYSMSQAIADAWIDMMKEYDKFSRKVDLGINPEIAIKDSQKVVNIISDKIFGEALNDISQVTNWSSRLIDAHSLDIGECNSFFDESEFSGWPIMEMPTQKKPFIKINGISYGFDYYSLFDNIYRALQKEIFSLKPKYVDTWSKRQNLSSENMVKCLFLKLLPGATAYTGNYYPVANSIKQMNENDVLIIYANYLLIIEVKAGSFPQTPPINDFDAHIKDYTKLAQEADSQCSRTINYINTHQPANFYNVDKQKKFEIKDISEFKEVYSFSVTIDNFNELAAKAEKISFITFSSKTIIISYDDLLVYEKYFDSPIYFLHYLKQRKLAIDIPQISLNDELDHLGMYIKYNKYSITALKYPKESRINWVGYRQDLDYYFCSLYHPGLNLSKPVQNIPEEIKIILHFLVNDKEKNRFDIANFLLDMSSESKEDFCKGIKCAIHRQREIGSMVALSGFGELKYCLFVSIPEIKTMNLQKRRDYVLASVLSDESKSIMWINLNYDLNGKMLEVSGKELRYCDIIPTDIVRLKEINIQNTKSKIASFHRQTHRKVGRNDPCPCGSGKKYKHCCLDINRYKD